MPARQGKFCFDLPSVPHSVMLVTSSAECVLMTSRHQRQQFERSHLLRPSAQTLQCTRSTQAMTGQGAAIRTPEEAFCAAVRQLAESSPEASGVEGGHKKGSNSGLLLLEPLYNLLAGNASNLSIDRFANHLMQLTSNQVRVSLGSYWKGQIRCDDALLVQHPSRKPMSLPNLQEVLRQSCRSIWLAQTSGT